MDIYWEGRRDVSQVVPRKLRLPATRLGGEKEKGAVRAARVALAENQFLEEGCCMVEGDHWSHIFVIRALWCFITPPHLFMYLYLATPIYEFYCTGTDLQWLSFFFSPPTEVGSSDRMIPPGLVFAMPRPGPLPLLCPGSTVLGFTAACWHSSYWIAH